MRRWPTTCCPTARSCEPMHTVNTAARDTSLCCQAAGGYDTVQPNPVPLNEYIGFYLETRTCINADATFASNASCVTPVETFQLVFCKVTSSSALSTASVCTRMMSQYAARPCVRRIAQAADYVCYAQAAADSVHEQPAPSLACLVQDYVIIDGNRTQIPGTYGFQLEQGQGPFGGAPDDYSTYGRKVSFFYPPEVVGQHEFECYGTATSDAFDPSPINTTTVTATFTGSIRSGQNRNRTASRSKFAPCMHGG